jgi:2-oxo-4-hydroxy-4-carboxy--5-ureidoimidazoline (OHCU) decarboxylase
MQKRTKGAGTKPQLAKVGDGSRSELLLELVEDLRTRLAKIDAFTGAAAEMFEQIPWSVPRARRRELTRLAYMLDQAATTVCEAVGESERRLRIALMHRDA